MVKRYLRTILLVMTILAASLTARAQEQDVRLSIEPATGPNVEQRWPGVIIQNGQLRVRWGELRRSPDTNVRTAELWYSLGHWAGRNDQGVLLVNSFRPEQIRADSNTTKVVLNPTGFEQPREFDGAVLAGSLQWRGDIGPAPGGSDTVYKSNYSLYVLRGDAWKKTVVFETKGPALVTLRNRAYGYDPVGGLFLTAWVTGRDTTGHVTAVDSLGTIAWNFDGIPMPAGVYNLVPLHDREFLLIKDSVATRYRNGVAVGTSIFPSRPGTRFQRIEGDRFLRSYVGPDTAHYTLEMYHVDGGMLRSRQILRPGANQQPSHFITMNHEDASIAFVMAGPDGVYATVVDTLLGDRMLVRQVSRGTDSAFSPSAVFYGDTLYVAWQDNRNTVPDIYGRAFATGTYVVGVDPDEPAVTAIGLNSVAPNPAATSTRVRIDMAVAGEVSLTLFDATGRTVRSVESMAVPEGSSVLEISVADLPSGAYRLVARTSRSVTSARVVVVH